jgi:hypothetical protein
MLMRLRAVVFAFRSIEWGVSDRQLMRRNIAPFTNGPSKRTGVTSICPTKL